MSEPAFHEVSTSRIVVNGHVLHTATCPYCWREIRMQRRGGALQYSGCGHLERVQSEDDNSFKVRFERG